MGVSSLEHGSINGSCTRSKPFFVSHTKNKNLLLLNEWAMQAVQYAETHLQGSAEKKQSALNFLTNKLNANKLGLKFDSKQLDAVIELAVSTLHGGKTND